MRRARLDRHRDPGVERGDRDRHRHQPLCRHRRQQVEVADDPVGLGGKHGRMVGLVQHLKHPPRHLPRRLDRLVRVGVGTQRNRLNLVARLRQFGAQQVGRLGLGEQPRFEIEPRRQVVIGVARPREAIDAAVLAPAIRVDRPGERHVGRLVATDDRPRLLDRHRRPQRRRRAVDLAARVEPVAIRLGRGQIEPRALAVQRSAPDGARLGARHGPSLTRQTEHRKNKYRACWSCQVASGCV